MLDIFEISPLDEGEIEKLHKEMMSEALAVRSIIFNEVEQEIREITKLLEDDYHSAGGDKESS